MIVTARGLRVRVRVGEGESLRGRERDAEREGRVISVVETNKVSRWEGLGDDMMMMTRAEPLAT